MLGGSAADDGGAWATGGAGLADAGVAGGGAAGEGVASGGGAVAGEAGGGAAGDDAAGAAAAGGSAAGAAAAGGGAAGVDACTDLRGSLTCTDLGRRSAFGCSFVKLSSSSSIEIDSAVRFSELVLSDWAARLGSTGSLPLANTELVMSPE